MNLECTGEMIAFLDLGIGSPFYAHGRVWIRTDFDCATEFGSTQTRRENRVHSCCNFLIDGTVEPEWGPYSHRGEKCELVEAVRFT